MEQYLLLCYSQHCRERSQHKAIPVLLILWICPKSYQLWSPRITSEGNENHTEKKKKEKISTKNPFPFNFHGKPYFSSTSQAAKNGCSNLGVKSGCWGPKLSRRFPFPGQQTLGKALNDCQSLRILFGQGCSLKFCSSKPQKLQRFTITWTAKILLCHSRAQRET